MNTSNIKNIVIQSFSLHNSKRSGKKNFVYKSETELEISLLEDDDFETFERTLLALRKKGKLYYKLLEYWRHLIVVMVPALVIAIGFASVSIYEDTFKQLLFSFPQTFGSKETIAVIISLFTVGMIAFLPALIAGENGHFEEKVRSWFNHEYRLTKRLEFLLKTLLRSNSSIHVYNVDMFCEKSWIWTVLIPSVIKQPNSLILHVRHDMKNEFSKKLEQIAKENSLSINIIFKDEKISKEPIRIEMLFKDEQRLLGILYFCSLYNLPKEWKKEKETELSSMERISTVFADFIFDILEKQDKWKNKVSFEHFLQRCSQDYGFCQFEDGEWYLNRLEHKPASYENDYVTLYNYLHSHPHEILHKQSDAIGLMIIYAILPSMRQVSSYKKPLISLLIDKLYKNEQYFLVSRYWHNIAGNIPDIKKPAQSFSVNSTTLYRELNVESLDALETLFERAGMFDEALLLSQFLYNYEPFKYHIGIARLYERKGEFTKAIKELESAEYLDFFTKESPVYLQYLQYRAWFIVSAREEEKKKWGQKALEEFESVLNSSNIGIRDTKMLWHLYNTKANYAEWEGDYIKAIEAYEKCLLMPGVGYYEYGGTFVNMGISYRLLADSKNIEEAKEKAKLSKIYGEKGVKLKRMLGDEDELPIALHNQALNRLTEYMLSPSEPLLQEVLDETKEACSILEKNGAKKRYAMLLCERYIAYILLGKDIEGDEVFNRLLEWVQNSNSSKQECRNIYNTFNTYLSLNPDKLAFLVEI
ncbi:hypothetical protein HUE87_00670 [Candidatus Sulfurimonas marisnigri]|uniref:Tetratricopeptide repeat protein n=1 Tax=Candidatus Sulfurimonas marisnigri TaxID=2740405 RepID=A0A7S7M0H4_9BACT|nr:hypothetical protein [Candidatus Sulfurimonas marisnigri]QOY54796.1 hypothetical protein HUE87_00670 [Candidatus Sulfurimonas marisnigri]